MNANGNLGRDKVWTSDIWARIDKGVTAEVGQVRAAQKVFPTTTLEGAQTVPADVFNPATMTIEEGQTKQVIEMWVPFPLTQSQVDSEGALHTGEKLARLAAKTLALAQDTILCQGQTANLPANVQIANRVSAGQGLVQDAASFIRVNRRQRTYPASLFQAVVQGISNLTALGQPGPYALLFEHSIFADAHRPEPNSLVTPADRITPLVPGGFYPTGALYQPVVGAAPLRFGLLASLGGEPVSIYVAADTTTAFTQPDPGGILRFRVFERVQYVARDPRSLLRFEFIN